MADENFWRDTAMRASFFRLDIRAMFVVPLPLFHFSLFNLKLMAVCLVIFSIMEWRGLRLQVALNMLKLMTGGLFRFPIRIQRPQFRRQSDVHF